MKVVLILTAAITLPILTAQEEPREESRPLQPPRGPQGPNGRRPVGPGMVQDGPWNRNLHLVVLSENGTVESDGFWLQAGGVPCLMQDEKGRMTAVFQWFPQGENESFDQVAISFSEDGGKAWTPPRKLRVKNLPEGMRRPYDPTLIALPDGKLRLFFTSHELERPDSSAIYSALSTDGGATFNFETGMRFSVEGTGIMDCAVTLCGGQWHMICPRRGGGAYHATSADGLSFTRAPDISGEAGKQWIGNLTVRGTTLVFWMGGREGVETMESPDGSNWKPVLHTKAPGMDPAALPLSGGRTLLLITSGGGSPGPGRPGISGPGSPAPRPTRDRPPDVELTPDLPPPVAPQKPSP